MAQDPLNPLSVHDIFSYVFLVSVLALLLQCLLVMIQFFEPTAPGRLKDVKKIGEYQQQRTAQVNFKFCGRFLNMNVDFAHSFFCYNPQFHFICIY